MRGCKKHLLYLQSLNFPEEELLNGQRSMSQKLSMLEMVYPIDFVLMV